MKLSLFIMLYFILLLVACDKKSTTEPETKTLVNTLWKLDSFEKDGEVINPREDQIYNLQFQEDSTLSAKSDCNTIMGRYFLKQEDSLIINNLATTKVYCGEGSLDQKYFGALKVAKSYRINKNKLQIYYDNSVLNFIDE